ncbi:MAG: alpha/beta hydrolase, partial [Cyanobacteria bacterium J06643_5]
PNSTLTWIKDSGHVPHLEQPQITAKEILVVSG